MKRILNYILFLQAVILLTACTVDDSEYNRKYQCYFVFDTSIHNTSLINSCVNPYSSGVFCMVTQRPVDGVRHIIVSVYGGKSEDNAITTEQERRLSCILGSDNGLIIGCSSLNDGALFAFDLKCPNCIEDFIYKTLEWDNSGNWVKCPRCKRSYDLNNSGFVVSGESGNKLIRYRSSYSGNFLRVSN